MSTLAERFKKALAEAPAGKKQNGLAAACGVKPPSVNAWVNGRTLTIESKNAHRAAAYLGVNSLWLSEGIGPMRPDSPGGSSMADPVNPSQESTDTPALQSVAHELSQMNPTLVERPTKWEEIKVNGVPEKFTLVLRDGALGDDFPRGAVGYFERFQPGVMEPMEGKGVLFRDKSGGLFVRLYEVQRDSQWRAVAAVKGYAPMESKKDGLTLLAVMLGGFWRPPSQ